MILADENIDDTIIAALRLANISVNSIKESSRGVNDETVIHLSQNPPQIILTEDKDFGEWVYAHQRKDISVILLRYHFSDTAHITEILIQLIKRKNNDLFGKYCTVTTEKIRIRSLK